MSAYYWLCRANCTWATSDSYQLAVTGNGVSGRIIDFNNLNTAIVLSDTDVFCMYALNVWDLRKDQNDWGGLRFRLTAPIPRPGSPTPQLYIWGHHAGGSGRYFLVVVTDGSPIHTFANARPHSWNQKGGPYAFVDCTTIKTVATAMST